MGPEWWTVSATPPVAASLRGHRSESAGGAGDAGAGYQVTLRRRESLKM